MSNQERLHALDAVRAFALLRGVDGAQFRELMRGAGATFLRVEFTLVN